MRHDTRSLVGHFLLRPARSLVAITDVVATAPRRAAAQLVSEPGGNLKRSLTYFLAAFSLAIIFHTIALAALGVETVQELPFWMLHVLVIICIAALGMILALPFQPASAAVFLNAALLSYGAGFLIGGFVLAGASLTLWVLRELGYTPDFVKDLTAFQSFEAIGMKAYYDCLRSESLIFNALFNGLGGAFEDLNEPIASLWYVLPAFHVVASVLFAALVYLAAVRRRAMATAAVLLSATIIYSILLIGLGAYDDHLHETTSCGKHSILAAGQSTAEDQVRILAEMHAKDIGKRGRLMTLIGVEAKQRSLVLRARVHEGTTDLQHFREWADGFRHFVVQGYCSTEHNFRRLGISRVWVLQYANTDAVETVVQGPDQCTN